MIQFNFIHSKIRILLGNYPGKVSYSLKPSLIPPGTIINSYVLLCVPTRLLLQLFSALYHKYLEIFEITFLALLLN